MIVYYLHDSLHEYLVITLNHFLLNFVLLLLRAGELSLKSQVLVDKIVNSRIFIASLIVLICGLSCYILYMVTKKDEEE